jgi:hypothetical protein
LGVRFVGVRFSVLFNALPQASFGLVERDVGDEQFGVALNSLITAVGFADS